jgi:histidyl-tRNA synthetase
LPGVGISIGLTRLFFVLKEIGFIEKYEIKNKLDYLIIPIGDTIEYCIKVMNHLQDNGKKVTVYFEESSLKKKMNYANKLDINNVIIIGEDEVEMKEVKIKNMITGESRNIDYRFL